MLSSLLSHFAEECMFARVDCFLLCYLCRPSSLDALVFGYLAPILKAPLPSNQLQNHLRQCDNLCTLVNQILQRFFPPTREGVWCVLEGRSLSVYVFACIYVYIIMCICS